MRFPIRISRTLRPLFSLFGFRAASSYLEIDRDMLRLRFGTADEAVPLADIGAITPRRWPIYYGLGAKLGPDEGVAYVGSREGVLQIELTRPHPLNVWGPFSRSAARAVQVSLEDPAGFVAAIEARRAATSG